MLRRSLDHMRHNVVAYLALFVALGGSTAYAADTIRSTDRVSFEQVGCGRDRNGPGYPGRACTRHPGGGRWTVHPQSKVT